MQTKRNINSQFFKHLIYGVLTFLILMVTTAACNLPSNDAADSDEQVTNEPVTNEPVILEEDGCGDDLACDTPEVVVTIEELEQIDSSEVVLFNGSIPNTTLCFWGPGADWDTVGSLIADLQVKIIGVGTEGWLIVENPNFEAVSCWVDKANVVVSTDLDLSSLPLFDTPALASGDSGGGGDEGGGGGGGGGSTGPGAPTAPSGLKITQECESHIVETYLNWTDNSSNEDGFRIYRNGELYATVGANVTQFTDDTRRITSEESYTVRAYNAFGESAGISGNDLGCVW